MLSYLQALPKRIQIAMILLCLIRTFFSGYVRMLYYPLVKR